MMWLLLAVAVANLLTALVVLRKVWAMESRLGYGVSVPAEQLPQVLGEIQRSVSRGRRGSRRSESQLLKELAELDESC